MSEKDRMLAEAIRSGQVSARQVVEHARAREYRPREQAAQ